MISSREAVESDMNQLANIYSKARISAGCFSRPAASPEEFKALVEGEKIYVAVRDSKLVGFVSVWVADKFIHHLYVQPEAQGAGVGSFLLDACTTIFGHPLSLKCEVSNTRAQQFYRSKGWVATETGSSDDGRWERLISSSPG